VPISGIEEVSVVGGGLAGARRKGPAGWHQSITIETDTTSGQFAVTDRQGLEAVLAQALRNRP
jgi:hypothetical protein